MFGTVCGKFYSLCMTISFRLYKDETLCWKWNDCAHAQCVSEVKYCSRHGGLVTSVGCHDNEATTSGKFVKTFDQPGVYYFVRKEDNKNNNNNNNNNNSISVVS